MARHRIHDRALLDALETIEPMEHRGPVWRVCRKGREPNRESTVVGRWSDGSFPVLYTSLEADTCQAEVYFHVYQKQPVPPSKLRFGLHKLSIELTRTLRLLDTAQLESLGVVQDLFYAKRFNQVVRESYPKTQAIGAAANFLGLDGLLVPSARVNGTNVVLLTDNIAPEREIAITNSEPCDLKAWGATKAE